MQHFLFSGTWEEYTTIIWSYSIFPISHDHKYASYDSWTNSGILTFTVDMQIRL